MALTYSFACPFCHEDWEFQEFAVIAKDVFSSFEGVGTCPRCQGTFSWVRPGTLKGTKWYEGKKHYKDHPCEWCGRKISGRHRFCNTQCNKKWYYRQSHPEVKYKTEIISPTTEKLEGVQ